MDWVTWALGRRSTITKGTIMEAYATRYASGEKARRLLGYEARVGIEEGLKISCDYYKNIVIPYGKNGATETGSKTELHCASGSSARNFRASPTLLSSKFAKLFRFKGEFSELWSRDRFWR